VRVAIDTPYDPAPGRQAIQSESWDAKADEVEGLLEGLFQSEAQRAA
jgi:hypothetical protein